MMHPNKVIIGNLHTVLANFVILLLLYKMKALQTQGFLMYYCSVDETYHNHYDIFYSFIFNKLHFHFYFFYPFFGAEQAII